MTNCSKEMIGYMHEYFDEEISPEKKNILHEHLKSCSECRKHFSELEKSIALVKSLSHIKAPENFTQTILMKLPREKKRVSFKRWLGHHPFLSAASVFCLLMTISFLSSWNEGENFSVTKQPGLVVENNVAIVPEGETVRGDIIVKNGDIRIDGKVEGDVTVVNGDVLESKKYMASAGEVTGDIEEINQTFEWLWYQIKNIPKNIAGLFSND